MKAAIGLLEMKSFARTLLLPMRRGSTQAAGRRVLRRCRVYCSAA